MAAPISAPLPCGGGTTYLGLCPRFGHRPSCGRPLRASTSRCPDDVDLYADYRFRSNELDHNFASAFSSLGPVHVTNMQENVVMVGLRWFMTPAAAASPAAGPRRHLLRRRLPRPPPPPPPPPPVKTFIVFFDFDKSNLTAEAQTTVNEAVSAAKTQGAVRILVTGHTDTVGSDAYNQALSIRRATSVKDEMVREGLGADSISIEGRASTIRWSRPVPACASPRTAAPSSTWAANQAA